MHQCWESWHQASDYPTTPVLDKDESCWLVHGTHGGVNLNGENSGIFKVFHRFLTGFWWVFGVILWTSRNTQFIGKTSPHGFFCDGWTSDFPLIPLSCLCLCIHVLLVFYPANTMQIYSIPSTFCRFAVLTYLHLLVSTTSLFSRWKLQFTGAPSDGFSHWSTDAGCEALRPHAGGAWSPGESFSIPHFLVEIFGCEKFITLFWNIPKNKRWQIYDSGVVIRYDLFPSPHPLNNEGNHRESLSHMTGESGRLGGEGSTWIPTMTRKAMNSLDIFWFSKSHTFLNVGCGGTPSKNMFFFWSLKFIWNGPK